MTIYNISNFKLCRPIVALLCFILINEHSSVEAKGISVLDECSAKLEDNILIIENSLISRTYRWNNGNIISLRINDKANARHLELAGNAPDFYFPGVADSATEGKLEILKQPEDSVTPAHLQVSVSFKVNLLEIKRIFRIFPGTSAIRCDYYLKGSIDRSSLETSQENPNAQLLGSPIVTNPEDLVVIERLALPEKQWKVKAIRFTAVTDYNNSLVQSDTTELYLRDHRLAGNLLLLENKINGQQLFVLKESPVGIDQLYYPGFDFIIGYKNIRVLGLGIRLNDIKESEWTKGYGFVTGIADEGELALLQAIRSYQENLRIILPHRDEMIMMNTWGDRSRDSRLKEGFSMRELEAGEKLGITHFQLDDGWQTGLSKNSASPEGIYWDDWNVADAWRPHPDRFPNGLMPLIERGREAGIQIAIWFNPSSHNSYENWQNDADVLIGLFNDYGIKTFKIDGILIPDKTAELNLRRFLDRVTEATDGQVTFNMDVTSGRRMGYHYFYEYGNLFLENRYTDWGNYYPYRTLRNLWMLSRYVPPQRLQIEFLNKWRNPDKYPNNDPFAPSKVPFDYVFAITMAAQPLAWFEGTGLPGEAFDIAPMVKEYRKLQSDLHKGQIFPIGDEPDGKSWTGFQSIQDGHGYFLIYRELNHQDTKYITTWLNAGTQVRLEHVFGHGKNFETLTGDDGNILFELSSNQSFALYRYVIK